jgi:hypothetical protein
MGGAVALKSHLKEPGMWDGAVLVAPMCKIADAMYPPWYLVRIMIALAYVIPKAKLVPHTDIAEIGFRNLEKRARVSVFNYLQQFFNVLDHRREICCHINTFHDTWNVTHFCSCHVIVSPYSWL